MSCCCPKYKVISLFKGDDTDFNGLQFLTFNFKVKEGSSFSFDGFTARFEIGDYSFTDDISDGEFVVSLSREITENLDIGKYNGVLTIIDPDGKEKTIENEFPFFVTNEVFEPQDEQFQVNIIDTEIKELVEVDVVLGQTGNYVNLSNLPSLNGHTIIGDKTSADYGIPSQTEITELEQELKDLIGNEQIQREQADSELSDRIEDNKTNIENLIARTTQNETDISTLNNIKADKSELETEKTNRENADKQLQDNIETLEDDLTEDIDALSNIVDSNYTTLDGKIDSNVNTLNTRITNVADELGQTIEENVIALQNEDTVLQNQINAHSQTLTAYDSRITSNTNAITQEISDRQSADSDLQEQIDAITASSDVKDVVGTYAELSSYDTSKLGNNDIIKVLQDETKNDAISYYRWTIKEEEGQEKKEWVFIGSQGPFYTKSESDSTFVPLTRKINDKTLNSDISLTYSDVGAQAPLTAGTGISIVNNVISNTQTSAEWGNITGTLSNQTDLQNLFDAKQDELTQANAGDNININFVTTGKNLLNVNSKNIATGYWNADNLTVGATLPTRTSSGNYYTSEPIEVVEGENLYMYGSGGSGVSFVFLDEERKFVSGFKNSNKSEWAFVVPTGAKYVRVPFSLDLKDVAQLERGTQHTEYEPYIDKTTLKISADLTDYVKKTDYASGEAGVVRTSGTYAVTASGNGYIQTTVKTATQYETLGDNAFIGKGTLENIKEDLVTSVGDSKYQGKLTAGNNITIDDNNVISATGGGGATYEAGNGIEIKDTIITSKNYYYATEGLSTATTGGVTYEPQDDGTVIVSGIATDYSSFLLKTFIIPEELKTEKIIIGGLAQYTNNISWANVALQAEDGTDIETLGNGTSYNISVDLSQYPTASKIFIAIKRKANNVDTSGIVSLTIQKDRGIYNINDKIPYTQYFEPKEVMQISTNTQFVITEDMFSLEYDDTKGVAPYSTSYGYTNVTISEDAGVEWVEGASYTFVLDTKVATSANRNVRVRIGESGDWKPVMATSAIAVGSTVFVKAINNIFFYKSTYQENGALHCFYDTNTTYTINYSLDAGQKKAGIGAYAVSRYSLIMQKPDMSWEKITDPTKNYTTATSKTVNKRGFLLNQIRYYNYTTNYANGALMSATYMYEKSASVTGSYSFNCGTAPNWAIGDYIYLVGTVKADGLFYLDETKWWDNQLPTTKDGKLYIQLGIALTTTDSTFSLYSDRPIYYHDGTSIRQYIQENLDIILLEGATI